MFREVAGPLSRLSLDNGLAEQDAPPKEFMASRFIDAVVALWVIIEARRQIMDIAAQAQTVWEEYQYDDIMRSFWFCSWQMTLLQRLDVMEIHDFFYGFLLRKRYYRRSIAWAGWSGTCNGILEATKSEKETEAIDPEWTRRLHLHGLCLNPVEAAEFGSVEEEIADMTPEDETPLHQTARYLQYNEIPPPLRMYGIFTLSVATLLEFRIGLDLLVLEEAQKSQEEFSGYLVEAWADFRRNWATTARGSIFHWRETSEELVERLRCWFEKRGSPPSDDAGFPTLEPDLDSFSLSLSREVLESGTVAFAMFCKELLDQRRMKGEE